MRGLICILAVAGLVGCSKKEVAEEIKNPNAVPSSQVAPVMEQVQKDIEAKKFEQAAASMAQMQAMAQMLSEQDAARYQNSMRKLQTSAAEAAARGDESAQKAIMMMRMMSPENGPGRAR